MNQSEMFGSAKWIDCEGGECAPIFIKKFSAVKGEKAEITICGLGWFDLHINGVRVGDELLVPSASNYSRRDMSSWSYPLYDEMGFRTYVEKYDISRYIADGENTAEIMLGTGYYHQDMRRAEGNVDYGTPKLCFRIMKDSGEAISDSGTLAHKGYFRRCNLYFGEFQDFTAVPGENEFAPAREIETPDTEFLYRIAPPDRVTETITGFKVIKTGDGIKLYDIGVNTVGRAVIRCGKNGEHVTVSYAEEIGGNERYGIHFSDDRYIDEFITDGVQSEYKTRFGWQGFRYVAVSENAELIRVDVIHTDCAVTSAFDSDSEIINWLYKTFIHTQLCNMHSGVPSDCPHRERLGYTGDGQLCAQSAMLLLDSRDFYRKWLYDIADCQCKKSGHVQHTAPAMGGGGGPCGWGGAIVEVPYRYYKIFGDRDVLAEFYPRILHFFEYLDSRSENSLVCREEEGGWCLGDWLPPTPIQIPETLVNSCLYIKFLRMACEIAEILGKTDDIPAFEKRIAAISKSVDAAYYSFQQGSYCGDINGASSLALDCGLGNEKVRKKVIEKYSRIKEYDTGIIATEALTRYLFETGEAQLAFDLLTNDNDVSFSHMMKSGATTLWENWDGISSRNHPMFGAVTCLLFTKLLGIGQPADSCGFEKAVISPCFVKGLDRASGSIETVSGRISVSYVKSEDGSTAKVSAKCGENIEAEFIYKDKRVPFRGKLEITVEV